MFRKSLLSIFLTFIILLGACGTSEPEPDGQLTVESEHKEEPADEPANIESAGIEDEPELIMITMESTYFQNMLADTVGTAEEIDLANASSTEMARLMGYGINLGNTMEAAGAANRAPGREPSVYEQMWGNPVTTQAMITGMRNAGFKTLRIPVAWTNAMMFAVGYDMDIDNWDYTIDPRYLERVEEIVNYALNEDMYVMINAHWDHGWWSMFGAEDPALRDAAWDIYTAMWTQVADYFEDYDYRLMFEASNEEWGDRFNDPTGFTGDVRGVLTTDECYALLNQKAQYFVDLIRDSGGNNPNRFLVTKGYCTDVEKTLDSRFILPSDPANRTLLSVHYYTPWSYCGDISGIEAWGSISEVEQMNDLLGSLTKFTDQGFGVILGEWGVLDNDGPDRLKFFTNFLDNSDKHGFAPILWDTGYTPRNRRLFDRNDTLRIVADEIHDLFVSREAAKEGRSAEDIIAAAEASMANNLALAAERPQLIFTTDEAYAWLMFHSSDYTVSYSVGDDYRPEQKAGGLITHDIKVTGPGTYTVGLDFTGVPGGFVTGTAFSAIGIVNAETLWPGYIMEITEVLINGEPAELEGVPYTTNDNPVTARVNLYNEWVRTFSDGEWSGEPPSEARVPAGIDMADASPVPLINYTSARIETIFITFEYYEG
ncbi:MAG: glycoside hydrolase family 5 protein [Oscillospiraceae bacterium]|jgi:endoglucanase|nr:glycoside hydrolase family 5 protein [Oscillospiraceae bacterium]